jgi:alpha-D-xyloside xylohydrolase
MPYIYAQAKDAATRGLPMVRALFIEYPDDPGSWLVEDEYLFGTDMLVAPLLVTGDKGRTVYVPPGAWIDYQTGQTYSGGWHSIDAGAIPIVVLVRDGAAIPHVEVAQSTKDIDWSRIEIGVFSATASTARGLVALPADGTLHEITLSRHGSSYSLTNDPLRGKVTWTVRRRAADPRAAGTKR